MENKKMFGSEVKYLRIDIRKLISVNKTFRLL